MIQRNTRDTVLLSGWLFADLLLGLMMIFLVSIQGAHIPPIPAPTLTVTPANLNTTNCQGGTAQPRCTVNVGETQESVGFIKWSVSSDINDSIIFSPPNGTLKPGETEQMTISSLPCQNGSFTFTGVGPKNSNESGSLDPNPVTIQWRCKAPPPPIVRLDTNPQRLTLRNVDYNGLLANSQSAINDVENQIRSQVPAGSSVGFAIVYDGTTDTNEIGTADSVDVKVYSALRDLGRQGFAFQNASYYDHDPLYTLGPDHTNVFIDVFYLINTTANQNP